MVVDIHTYTVFYLKKNNRKILHVQERKKKMTNKELTKIREERKLNKKEFAVLLGITPMLLGRYVTNMPLVMKGSGYFIKKTEAFLLREM